MRRTTTSWEARSPEAPAAAATSLASSSTAAITTAAGPSLSVAVLRSCHSDATVQS